MEHGLVWPPTSDEAEVEVEYALDHYLHQRYDELMAAEQDAAGVIEPASGSASSVSREDAGIALRSTGCI